VTEQPPYTITIRQPADWMTANTKYGHWAAEARAVKAWRDASYLYARSVKPALPKGLARVRVSFEFRWGRPPVRELRNLEPTIKAIVDGAIGPSSRSPGRNGGMVRGYGIVPDDNDKRVEYGQNSCVLDTRIRPGAGLVVFDGHRPQPAAVPVRGGGVSVHPFHIDTIRALNVAARGTRRGIRAEYRPGVVCRYEGRTVTMASRFQQYAVSRHYRAKFRHEVRGVYLAWQHGRVVGWMVWCWCGNHLTTAQLMDTSDVPECKQCQLKLHGYVLPRIDVTVTVGGGS